MAPSAVNVPADLARFLAIVHPVLQRTEYIELRYLEPVRRDVRRSFVTSAEALLDDVVRRGHGHHVFVGIALRAGGGCAEHVTRLQTLYADVDAKLFGEDLAAGLAAIEAFPIPPTLVVNSGGGWHPYWGLDEPVDVGRPGNRERIERLNRAVARAVCGPERRPDAVHDIARVMRLPGTVNHKPQYGEPRPVTLATCEPSRRYDVNALEAALAESYAWAFENSSPRPQSQAAGPPQRGENRPTTAFRGRAMDLLSMSGAAGYRSPSEADAACAAALVRAGLTEAEALAKLWDSPRGADAAARKGRGVAQYLERTVANAAAYVGPVIDRGNGRRVRQFSGPQPALSSRPPYHRRRL